MRSYCLIGGHVADSGEEALQEMLAAKLRARGKADGAMRVVSVIFGSGSRELSGVVFGFYLRGISG